MAVVYLIAALGSLQAQIGVSARVASVTGHPTLASAGASRFELTRGYELNPGDVVDTQGGARVVIDLSDGSVVIVQPDSIVTLKDFQTAGSLRELFEITLGRVRVKISHFGGRPNPYRMNTPTASIAVRGTEFSIAVDSSGDTRVAVYEGAVEVSSLADPEQKVLLEAGRGVLLAPGQGFNFFSTQGDNDVAANHDNDRHSQPSSHSGPSAGQSSSVPSQHAERDNGSLRSTVDTYARFINNLWATGEVPFLLRYNAFAEPYLDTLENPAYATGFKSAEARVYLFPTVAGMLGPESAESFGEGGEKPPGYGLLSQATLFAPIRDTGLVVGANFETSRLSNGIQGLAPSSTFPSSIGTNGSDISNFISGSFTIARKFGDRDSFGVSMERVSGSGSLSKTALSDESSSLQQTSSSSAISETLITAGYDHEFSGGRKAGLFYRYAFVGADNGSSQGMLGQTMPPGDTTHSSGHSLELGFRLRGALTQRLFYGLDASWAGVSLMDSLIRTGVNSNQRDGAQRGSVGLGVGYALNRRSVISLDIAGGASSASTARHEDATGNVLQTGYDWSRFVSAHVALQTDVWRRLYVLASFLNIWQAHTLQTQLFPDQFGNTAAIADPFIPVGSTLRPASHYSDFGAGWRFSPNLLAQFTYSTDYGVSSGSSSLMIRYTFRLRRE